MARLNLYQCLSVAEPNYEDAFCLGQHAMMDTAQCVDKASGWSAPARGVMVPVARPTSIRVPVALTTSSDQGPDQIDAAASPGDPADTTPPGAPPPMERVTAYGSTAGR